MNFLAHLYLSGNDIEIRLGNFIGDYIKGKRFDQYPAKVQTGIKLHRAIDSLTDNHPSTRICKELLKPAYGRYAGVVTDVLFDHILANEWENYSHRNLKNFTRTFYMQMLQQHHLLPPEVRRFLPFMIQSNRLYSYKSTEGIHRALEIMSNHTTLPSKTDYAIEQLTENIDIYKTHFNLLFADLINLSINEYEITLG
ncbi:MAG: ACP phosphodiesterase [Bacteroidales bacterium]